MADIPVDGVCNEQFAKVGAAFRDNFEVRGELGAAVCVYKDGQPVVDLWGGHLEWDRNTAWQRDTIVCMASITKSMTALCLHILVERGQVDLDLPMATYWPEFAQAGKAEITVLQTLGHNDGVIFNDAAKPGDWLNHERIGNAIASQAPAWTPGSRGAYNSFNYGFLVGEIIRRVDGRSPGQFLRDEIITPLGVDYQIGVRVSNLARVSNLYPNTESTTLNAFKDPETNLARAWHSLPTDSDERGPLNRDDFRLGEFPSGNGTGNARAPMGRNLRNDRSAVSHGARCFF